MIEAILEKYKHDGYGTEESCNEILQLTQMKKRTDQLWPQIGVFVTAGLIVLGESFHVMMNPRRAGLQSVIELATCILSIVFVADLTECHATTGLSYGWQWQMGAITYTFSWVALISYVKMFPNVGIYVVMVTDILRTLVRLSLIVALFILAFSFGFHSLLAEQVFYSSPNQTIRLELFSFQEVFAHAGFSAIKTMVMMLGEMDFADMLAQHVTSVGIMPTFHMPYPLLTSFYFVVFCGIISILLMNMMVAVAIDNVTGVQDNAFIERLIMQVKVSLTFEMYLSYFLGVFGRKHLDKIFKEKEEVYPNKRRRYILLHFFSDIGTLQRIGREVVEKETLVGQLHYGIC